MDTSALAKLVSYEGPFASLYLGPKGNTEAAAKELDLRLRSLREGLAEQGADAATVEALDRAVDQDDGTASRGLFAAQGRLLHEQRIPEPVDDLGTWGVLPHLLPLFSAAQCQVPYVLVLADRVGADVLAYAEQAEHAGPVLAEEISGSHDEIRRVAPGGWAQRRYQHRAEDSWEGNAREVAEHVGGIAGEIGARLVLVSGDVRAVQFLREHLPAALQPLVQVIEDGGGRAADGSGEVVAHAVREHVLSVAAADTNELLGRFQEECGQHDRAADGLRATVEAFQQARVETLLVGDDPADVRTAWFGPDATHVALEPRALTDLGVERPLEGRLADVLVRAALGTSAGVRVVPPYGSGLPHDGVGALLRWS